MTTTHDDPRAELLGICGRMRHLRAEHLRAAPDGAVRRKLEGDMKDASEQLERRLTSLVPDEADRAAWRDHARHGAPAPERPTESEAAPAGTGRPPDRPSGRRPWPR